MTEAHKLEAWQLREARTRIANTMGLLQTWRGNLKEYERVFIKGGAPNPNWHIHNFDAAKDIAALRERVNADLDAIERALEDRAT